MASLLRRATAAAALHRPTALLLPAAPISSAVTRLPVLIRPAPPAFPFSPRRPMCILTESELNDLKSELIKMEAEGVAQYGSTSTSILKLEIEVDKLCKDTADKAHLTARAVGNTSFMICGVVLSAAVVLGMAGLLALYAAGARAAKNAAGDYVDQKLTEVKMIVEKKVADQYQEDMDLLRHADMKLDSRAAAIKVKEEELHVRQAAITLKKTGATKHGEEGQEDDWMDEDEDDQAAARELPSPYVPHIVTTVEEACAVEARHWSWWRARAATMRAAAWQCRFEAACHGRATARSLKGRPTDGGYLQGHGIYPYVVATYSDGGQGAYGYCVYPMGDGSAGYFQPAFHGACMRRVWSSASGPALGGSRREPAEGGDEAKSGGAPSATTRTRGTHPRQQGRS
ncbi:hypothetical protein TRIUR3_06895 [Triticum urartu]|uniref:Uncharacterized protein n=1 Tax=Triticum urartu TaxID=4572 RepID=M8A0L7_TRIUA|nr:hypothetical protein TRIUR3_06895 [Triticum urartu]